MMKWINFQSLILFALPLALILGGCSSQEASSAVEDYIEALAAKDANRLVNLSCAAWEEQARIELDSLEIVETSVEGLQCQDAGKDNGDSLVSCKGKILLSYDGEDQEIDLETHLYRVVNEGGEWRVCGYD